MSVPDRIKFRCESCEKPLSIGRRKAGAQVSCPKCKQKVVVPKESNYQKPAPVEDDENPFSQFEVYDDEFDEPELVYEDAEGSGDSIQGKLNDRLSVPRKVVYFQGALLGIVAVFFFYFGLVIGNFTAPKQMTATNESKVSGMVVVDDGNQQVADEGAVVFLFPSQQRPEQKYDSEELIPGRMFTSANPEVPLIRRFGGNVCATNRNGYFQLSIPADREYILMVVSAGGQRAGDLDSNYYSDLGQYFTSLDSLIEDRICFYKRILPDGKIEDVGTIRLQPRGG